MDLNKKLRDFLFMDYSKESFDSKKRSSKKTSDIVYKAYYALFNKEFSGNVDLKYSRAFKGYNANVKYTKNLEKVEFRLSYNWKEVSDEIKIGLIQSLFNKMFKTNIKTINIDLYDIFLKKIPQLSPKLKSEPILEESFNRVNEEYFNGLLDKPNLEFGGINFHTLGTYEHNSDTIRISEVLKKDLVLLDYVMYHEMLHKKLKYKVNENANRKRILHHSKEFRELEKKFKIKDIEDRLKNFIKKEKLKNRFFGF